MPWPSPSRRHPATQGRRRKGCRRPEGPQRFVCIGDLHGHIDKATKVWAALEAELGASGLAAAQVVFLGDYCDRGPNTREVLDWLIWIEASRAAGSTAFLAGNHDFAFACFLGCLEGLPEGFDLDGTKDPRYNTGYWLLEVRFILQMTISYLM